MARFIQIAPGRVINVAHIFDAEWITTEDGAPELQLSIAGAHLKLDNDDALSPMLLFLEGEAADRAWAAILGEAERLPAPAVPLLPMPQDEAAVTVTSRQFELSFTAEIDSESVDVAITAGGQVEVFTAWANGIAPERFLAAARGVEAITSHPDFARIVAAAARPAQQTTTTLWDGINWPKPPTY